MEKEKCIELMKNKLTAIIKTIQTYKEKAREDERLKKYIKLYLKNHNISNIPLLRRFANPIKDPDPLASTMIALSYKFPIIVKTDKIQELKLTEQEKKELLEERKGLTRRPGWTGCKKELVDVYIDRTCPPSEDLKKTINLLYEIEDKKVRSYNNMVVNEIFIGMQSERREKIQLQDPVIEGMKQSQKEQLIVKILSPESLCSKRVQEIYDANKEKLKEMVPHGVTLTNQASALRAILDNKERFMPILQSKMPSSMYQHATMIFSNYWQAKISYKEKEQKRDTNEERDNIKNICESLVHTFKYCPSQIDIEKVCRILKIGNETLYEILEEAPSSNSVCVNYIKCLLDMESKNGMEYHGRTNAIIGFNDVEPHNNVHTLQIQTDNVGVICHIANRNIKINMGWTTYSEIKEIYYLCLTLRDIYFGHNPMSYSLEEIVEKRVKRGLHDDNIISKGRALQKNAVIMNLKMIGMPINNYQISTINSPDSIVLNEVVAAMAPLPIKTKKIKWGGIPKFLEINKKKIINISHFVMMAEKTIYTEMNEENSLLATREYIPFLQCVEHQKRMKYLLLMMSQNMDIIYNKIYRGEYESTYLYFDDCMSAVDMSLLKSTCYILLNYNSVQRKLDSLSPVIVAFWYIFASPTNDPNVKIEYNIYNGETIDLDFKAHNQKSNNMLWIDGDKNIRCYSHYLSGSKDSMENYMRIAILKNEYPRFRMEAYTSSKSVEIKQMKEIEALLSSSSSSSDQFYIANHMGLLIKVWKDSDNIRSQELSLGRMSKLLKRGLYFDREKMHNFSSKRMKKDE